MAYQYQFTPFSIHDIISKKEVDNMIIGSHVNFGTEQLLGCAKQAVSYGANTFMFYTGAPQNTIRKKIDENLTLEAKKYMNENGIDINNVICHAPYIINLANRENEMSWNFSCAFLKQEIARISEMGVNFIVVHPGNSLKINRDVAIDNIASAINLIIDDRIVERGFGTLEGKLFNHEATKNSWDYELDYDEYGIETIKEVLKRAKNFRLYE